MADVLLTFDEYPWLRSFYDYHEHGLVNSVVQVCIPDIEQRTFVASLVSMCRSDDQAFQKTHNESAHLIEPHSLLIARL